MDNGYVSLAAAADIAPGSCKSFAITGLKLIIAHLADGFYAVEDRCSHAGSPLDTSRIYKGSQIVCPLHGARFDMRTGAAKTVPAFRALKVFPVRVSGGIIEVDLHKTA